MATNGSFLGFLHKSGLSALPNKPAIRPYLLVTSSGKVVDNLRFVLYTFPHVRAAYCGARLWCRARERDD